ncbi:MAG TPA: methyltransferase domain-containing protein [bacterium]|nr:methyltransferase domain-containing protein [Chlamydiota bacterium]HOE26493.1 methyltransferase domain-containing protein [bacterium]HQM52588.1 methyltransferase domain-containing protein [bacterium]
MSRIRFFLNFIRSPRQVGSVTPSSRWLCRRLLGAADLPETGCVVEFGPGTACLTRMILDALPAGARLMAFEINQDFVEMLQRELPHPRLLLVNDSAEHVERHLRARGYDGADYIFSGLPFTTIPSALRERILRAAYAALKPGGKFIAYQYSLILRRMLLGIFDDVRLGFEPRNIPPAFCFVCTKRSSEPRGSERGRGS